MTDERNRGLSPSPLQILAFLVCVVCVIAPLAVGQESARDASMAERLRGLERSKFDALMHKDNAILDSMFDSALMRVDSNGRLWNKADFLADSLKSSVVLLRIVPESMTVGVFGDVAIVVGIYEEKGVISGRPYVRRCRFIDTWAFKNGKWVCIAETTTTTIS